MIQEVLPHRSCILFCTLLHISYLLDNSYEVNMKWFCCRSLRVKKLKTALWYWWVTHDQLKARCISKTTLILHSPVSHEGFSFKGSRDSVVWACGCLCLNINSGPLLICNLSSVRCAMIHIFWNNVLLLSRVINNCEGIYYSLVIILLMYYVYIMLFIILHTSFLHYWYKWHFVLKVKYEEKLHRVWDVCR